MIFLLHIIPSEYITNIKQGSSFLILDISIQQKITLILTMILDNNLVVVVKCDDQR